MISKKTTEYLKKNKIPYKLLDHKTVYTAYDAAQTMKVRLEELMKSLMVKVDKDYYHVALPANKNLDFALLKNAVKLMGGSVKKVEIPGEKVLTKVFKIKPGALTGFGSLHKVKVILDQDLKKVKDVVVSGGSLTQSLLIKLNDYINLEKPFVASIGKKKKFVLVVKKVRPKKKNKKTAKRRR